jgi:hypothetical protein
VVDWIGVGPRDRVDQEDTFGFWTIQSSFHADIFGRKVPPSRAKWLRGNTQTCSSIISSSTGVRTDTSARIGVTAWWTWRPWRFITWLCPDNILAIQTRRLSCRC